MPANELVELCLRLAKYKLENKELLNYLLFETANEDGYIKQVEKLVEEQFAELPKGSHQQKKAIRKILRLVNKQIKYSGQKETEVQLRLHFVETLKQKVSLRFNTALTKLYEQQVAKIKAAIGKLHEDLQYDYQRQLEKL